MITHKVPGEFLKAELSNPGKAFSLIVSKRLELGPSEEVRLSLLSQGKVRASGREYTAVFVKESEKALYFRPFLLPVVRKALEALGEDSSDDLTKVEPPKVEPVPVSLRVGHLRAVKALESAHWSGAVWADRKVVLEALRRLKAPAAILTRSLEDVRKWKEELTAFGFSEDEIGECKPISVVTYDEALRLKACEYKLAVLDAYDSSAVLGMLSVPSSYVIALAKGRAEPLPLVCEVKDLGPHVHLVPLSDGELELLKERTAKAERLRSAVKMAVKCKGLAVKAAEIASASKGKVLIVSDSFKVARAAKQALEGMGVKAALVGKVRDAYEAEVIAKEFEESDWRVLILASEAPVLPKAEVAVVAIAERAELASRLAGKFKDLHVVACAPREDGLDPKVSNLLKEFDVTKTL